LRTVAIALVVVGAVVMAGSAVIHLHLWAEKGGYRQIPTIGDLFLAQGISGVVGAVVMPLTRRLVVIVAGAAWMAASIGGLWVSVSRGLFGFNETMSAPYAGLALGLEIAGLVTLATAALVVATARRAT
jgi:hypothetical protein